MARARGAAAALLLAVALTLLSGASSSRVQAGVAPLVRACKEGTTHVAQLRVDGLTFDAFPDTASPFTSVASSYCEGGCGGVHPVDAWNATAKLDKAFEAPAAGGTATLVVHTRDVVLAGLDLNIFPVGSIVHEEGVFPKEGDECHNAAQAVLGLALPKPGPREIKRADEVTNDGFHVHHIPAGFALQLCEWAEGHDEMGRHVGHLWLGGYSTRHTTGKMRHTPLLEPGPSALYRVEATSMSVRGKRVKLPDDLNTPGGGEPGPKTRGVVVATGRHRISLNTAPNGDALVAAMQASGVIDFPEGVDDETLKAFWHGEGAVEGAKLAVPRNATLLQLGLKGGITVDVLVGSVLEVGKDGLLRQVGLDLAGGGPTSLNEAAMLSNVFFFDRVKGTLGVAKGHAHRCEHVAKISDVDVFAGQVGRAPRRLGDAAVAAAVLLVLLLLVLVTVTTYQYRFDLRAMVDRARARRARAGYGVLDGEGSNAVSLSELYQPPSDVA